MSMIWKKFFGLLSEFGVDATDSDEVRQEKIMLVAASIASGSSALVWGVIYSSQGKVVAGGILLVAMMIFS